MVEENVTTPEKHKFNWARLFITIGLVFLTALLVGGGVWYVMDSQEKKAREEEQKIENLEVEVTPKETTEIKKDEITEEGTIEGSFTFPSEGIPSDIVTYAENTVTGTVYKTTTVLTGPKYKYQKGFKIEVPAGTYYVYATKEGFTDNAGNLWKAYYNQFVVCGMSVDCKDVSKIAVKVEAGKTTDLILIGDWYPVK